MTSTITVHDGNGKNPTVLNREQYEKLKSSGMLWEFHPDAPAYWPEEADDRRVTTEDVLGDFGFRLVWRVRDHWADVVAYEITARDSDNSPFFNALHWKSLPDPVSSHEIAESYLEGYVKWDGCTELDQGRPHWCGPTGYKKHCDLLRYIYNRAHELMGREPEEKWDDMT